VNRRLAVLLVAAASFGCRIESAAPQSAGVAAASSSAPRGDVWVYTSMYPHVVDALGPVLKKQLPEVNVRWFQSGSEKIATRLEGELAAGGTQADLLVTSDPFLYERFKREGRWLRYASPNGLRTPRALIDLDGAYSACRLSTMILVHRKDAPAPASFAELADPKWKGEVALGDPMTSGTSFTWAMFVERKYGREFFGRLRANEARVAGGNAAVLQKVEGGEAKVGVLLLENALAAREKGEPIERVWPDDGAVIIPGYLGLFASTRNPVAAKAVYDALLSSEAQALIVSLGDMHAIDPRLPGPRGELGLDELLEHSQAWDDAMLERGVAHGAEVKAAFAKAFSQ
jgi:iron(III) transport system substrate-binding protein